MSLNRLIGNVMVDTLIKRINSGNIVIFKYGQQDEVTATQTLVIIKYKTAGAVIRGLLHRLNVTKPFKRNVIEILI